MELARCVSLGGLLVLLAAVIGGCTETETRTVIEPLPTPVPSQTPEPAKRPLPHAEPEDRSVIVSGEPPAQTTESGVTGGGPSEDASGGEVTGGGPGGDPAAVARIEAQLPVFLGYTPYNGDQALSFINDMVRVFPALAPLSSVTKVVGCAIEYGVVAARGYLAPDFSHGGAVVVVSHMHIQPANLATIGAKCFIFDVLGGGPGFQPCLTSYMIDNQVEGVNDRYYVFVGGSFGGFCDAVRMAHSAFNPRPIDV